MTTDTLNAFATYGVTDRLDIGVAVPINRVDVQATLTARIGFTSSGIDDPEPLVTSQSGTKSGIGDVVIRAKYNMLKGNTWGIAESVDVRLPTGDELNLLGIAGPQVKLTFIASSTVGALSPHVNLAYTISGTSAAGDDPDTYVIAASGRDQLRRRRRPGAVASHNRRGRCRRASDAKGRHDDMGASRLRRLPVTRSTSSSISPRARTSTSYSDRLASRSTRSGTCCSRPTCCSRSRRTGSPIA